MQQVGLSSLLPRTRSLCRNDRHRYYTSIYSKATNQHRIAPAAPRMADEHKTVRAPLHIRVRRRSTDTQAPQDLKGRLTAGTRAPPPMSSISLRACLSRVAFPLTPQQRSLMAFSAAASPARAATRSPRTRSRHRRRASRARCRPGARSRAASAARWARRTWRK